MKTITRQIQCQPNWSEMFREKLRAGAERVKIAGILLGLKSKLPDAKLTYDTSESYRFADLVMIDSRGSVLACICSSEDQRTALFVSPSIKELGMNFVSTK